MRRVSAALFVALGVAAAPCAAGSASVEWTDSLLTVEAVDTPLRDVLREVGEKSGTPMSGLENVEGKVTLSLRRMPLAQALEELVGKRPHARNIMHRPPPGKSGIELQFYPRSAAQPPGKGATDPAPPRGARPQVTEGI